MAPEHSELKQIIKGCKKGKSESFEKLIDAYSSRLYGFFYRLSGDRTISEDLLSELFVKLVEKISYYHRGNFDGWLFRVASNIWHDRLRSKKRQQNAIEGRREQLQQQHQQERFSDFETQTIDRLDEELEKLDEQSRELIVLRYYSQLSFKEIAEIRGLPIGTVLSKVHRGLKSLRESMEQYNNE